MKFIIEIDEADKVLADSLAAELGIKLQPYEDPWTRVRRCGSGFGDMVWRVNYAKDRIEISFAKPCETSKLAKKCGFRWHNKDGVWFAPNLKAFADVCEALKLKQVDGVPATAVVQ